MSKARKTKKETDQPTRLMGNIHACVAGLLKNGGSLGTAIAACREIIMEKVLPDRAAEKLE